MTDARFPKRLVEALPPNIEPDVVAAVVVFEPKREFPVPPKIEPEVAAVDELAFPPKRAPDVVPNDDTLPVELEVIEI